MGAFGFVNESLIVQVRLVNVVHRFRDERSHLTVFINWPPDLRQARNRKLLDDIVGALDAHEYNNVRFA